MLKSSKLVVEVGQRNNWQNEYARKIKDYEALGIPELGGKRYKY